MCHPATGGTGHAPLCTPLGTQLCRQLRLSHSLLGAQTVAGWDIDWLGGTELEGLFSTQILICCPSFPAPSPLLHGVSVLRPCISDSCHLSPLSDLHRLPRTAAVPLTGSGRSPWLGAGKPGPSSALRAPTPSSLALPGRGDLVLEWVGR